MPPTLVHPPGNMIRGVSVEIKIRGGGAGAPRKLRYGGGGAPQKLKYGGGGAPEKFADPPPHYFLNGIALTFGLDCRGRDLHCQLYGLILG